MIFYPVDPPFKSPARAHAHVLGAHAERYAVQAGGQPVCDFGRHRYLELPGSHDHLAVPDTPGSRFIAGEPTKLATKVSRGWL